MVSIATHNLPSCNWIGWSYKPPSFVSFNAPHVTIGKGPFKLRDCECESDVANWNFQMDSLPSFSDIINIKGKQQKKIFNFALSNCSMWTDTKGSFTAVAWPCTCMYLADLYVQTKQKQKWDRNLFRFKMWNKFAILYICLKWCRCRVHFLLSVNTA